MNKYKLTVATLRLGGFWSLLGREYGRKAFAWSVGGTVQRGNSCSWGLGLMSPQVPHSHLLVAGTRGSMERSAMVNALHSLGLPPASLPSPRQPVCTGSLDISVQTLPGIPIQVMGIRKNLIVMY